MSHRYQSNGVIIFLDVNLLLSIDSEEDSMDIGVTACRRSFPPEMYMNQVVFITKL